MNFSQIDPGDIDPVVREFNRGLMVLFINQDRLSRAGLDLRCSIVLYDEDRRFVYALEELPCEATMHRLAEEASVRYWSRGV
jgi:hypothetical protein